MRAHPTPLALSALLLGLAAGCGTTRMSDSTRLGVIGVGDVAQRDYLPEIHRVEPDAVVVAVAGARPERVREVAERLGVAAHVGYPSLLDDDDVDAVLNLTPAPLHDEVNAAAIGAGKHLYSEKPVAMTAGAAGLTTSSSWSWIRSTSSQPGRLRSRRW